MLQSDVANINFLSAMMINLKLNDILFNEGKRGNERITMTLLHIRIKKKQMISLLCRSSHIFLSS